MKKIYVLCFSENERRIYQFIKNKDEGQGKYFSLNIKYTIPFYIPLKECHVEIYA